MQTVTKKQLTDAIAERTGHKRVVVKEVVQHFLDEIVDELAAGNRLEFRDFGVFETKQRKPRVAQNPRTLERVHVPIKWTVKFKIGRLMKEKIQELGNGQSTPAEAVRSEAPRQNAGNAAQPGAEQQSMM